MSVRVLKIKPGEECPHSFMDNLESFFWLLLWSVAAHLDPDQYTAAPSALNTLHQMDQDRMESIAAFKVMILGECSGAEIVKRVISFENEWAKSPSIGLLVFTMGGYLSTCSQSQPTPEPTAVFPKIIEMISKALVMERGQ